MIKTTKFYDDFLNYYKKAKALQTAIENEVHLTVVNDPLMENVHIYDCVERRMAGFSNVLQDLHGKRSPTTFSRIPVCNHLEDKVLMRFLHLIHRFTGSGASFEEDHGYRNSIIPKLVEFCNHVYDRQSTRDSALLVQDCINIILSHCGPTVTSKGNQPPSLKNSDPKKYKLAQHYYFDNFAYDFIIAYNEFLIDNFMSRSGPRGIQKAVDFCLKWHKDRGFKQWKFVMTAFVMDDAEYYPEDIDPNSACYYGSNCIKAFKLMFERPKSMKTQAWHDKCMELMVQDTQGQPYSLEDVACDMIRYWTEYVPKNGYGHLNDEQKRNNSILKINGEYPENIVLRMDEVLK